MRANHGIPFLFAVLSLSTAACSANMDSTTNEPANAQKDQPAQVAPVGEGWGAAPAGASDLRADDVDNRGIPNSSGIAPNVGGSGMCFGDIPCDTPDGNEWSVPPDNRDTK